jgi:hypothetical protein
MTDHDRGITVPHGPVDRLHWAVALFTRAVAIVITLGR